MKKTVFLIVALIPTIAVAKPTVNKTPNTYEGCLHPEIPLSIGEKAVKLNKGEKGIFTVSSIADKLAKNQDFLVFYNRGYCYEIDSGYKGKDYKIMVEKANKIIGN